MKTKLIFFATILFLFILPVFAEDDEYDDASYSLISLWEQKFAIRVGGGYALSDLSVDVEDGDFGGAALVVVEKDSVDRDPGYSGSFGFKYTPSRPLGYISFGLNIDYVYLPINNFELVAQNAQNEVISDEDDLANAHVITFIPFLEARYPFELGKVIVAPYIQVGMGAGIYISDDDVIDFEYPSFAYAFGGGVEIVIGKNTTLYLEAMYRRNKTDFTLEPIDNSDLDGEIHLNSVTLNLGVNFYFS